MPRFVHQKALWCTNWCFYAIWYTKRPSGVRTYTCLMPTKPAATVVPVRRGARLSDFSPPSLQGQKRLCCGTRPFGRTASNGLRPSSHSGSCMAAESSRRAAGNYFSAGLPKNQFPLRCPQPPPLVSPHAAPGPAFLPPTGCRRLSSSCPTRSGISSLSLRHRLPSQVEPCTPPDENLARVMGECRYETALHGPLVRNY